MVTDSGAQGNVRFAVAVHVLVLLALDDSPVRSDEIAGSVATNPVVIRRLVGQLARAGLVRARTGPGGGVRLARAADAITLADVFRAVDASGAATRRHLPNTACPVGFAVPDVIRRVGERAEQAFLTSLASTTLAEAARDVRRRMPRGASVRHAVSRKTPAPRERRSTRSAS